MSPKVLVPWYVLGNTTPQCGEVSGNSVKLNSISMVRNCCRSISLCFSCFAVYVRVGGWVGVHFAYVCVAALHLTVRATLKV